MKIQLLMKTTGFVVVVNYGLLLKFSRSRTEIFSLPPPIPRPKTGKTGFLYIEHLEHTEIYLPLPPAC